MSNKENITEQEITLGHLLKQLQGYFQELLRYWWILLLVGGLMGAWQFYSAKKKTPMYNGTLTFMLAESSGGGGMSGILGQFGGLLGAGGGNYQLEKVLELARSRKLVASALFAKSEIDGQRDYLANHIIRREKLHEFWKKDTALNSFLFKHAELKKFTRTENAALLFVYSSVVQGISGHPALVGTSANTESEILTMTASTASEGLTVSLLDTMFNRLDNFYLNSALEKDRETYDILVRKRDSLKQALSRNDYATARFNDQSGAFLFETNKIPKARYQRDNQVLSMGYAEAVKNAELAKYSLEAKRPFLTLIDSPIPPIAPTVSSAVKSGIIGFMIGMVLAIVVILVRRIVLEALKSTQ